MSEALNRKLEVVENKLKDMYEDIIPLWNEYCVDVCSNDTIYNNDEEFFNEHFSDPYEAIRCAFNGDYSYTSDYVKFDGYGNLESISFMSDAIEYDELAKWYLEYYEDECEEWFDELYEELEKEAIEIALMEIKEQEEVDSDVVWEICNDMADDYDCDVDELYDIVMEKLN